MPAIAAMLAEAVDDLALVRPSGCAAYGGA